LAGDSTITSRPLLAGLGLALLVAAFALLALGLGYRCGQLVVIGRRADLEQAGAAHGTLAAHGRPGVGHVDGPAVGHGPLGLALDAVGFYLHRQRAGHVLRRRACSCLGLLLWRRRRFDLRLGQRRMGRRLAEPRHASAADRAGALGRGAPVLQPDRLSVLHLSLGSTLGAICFSHNKLWQVETLIPTTLCYKLPAPPGR